MGQFEISDLFFLFLHVPKTIYDRVREDDRPYVTTSPLPHRALLLIQSVGRVACIYNHFFTHTRLRTSPPPSTDSGKCASHGAKVFRFSECLCVEAIGFRAIDFFVFHKKGEENNNNKKKSTSDKRSRCSSRGCGVYSVKARGKPSATVGTIIRRRERGGGVLTAAIGLYIYT